MPTFATVLADRLRHEPGRPLVTFYDDATGERVELSVTTYANWVAKAGSLLVDEVGLERGDTLLLDLPPHWLTPVFLGAAWSAGLVVTDEEDASAVVCGPDRLDRWAGEAAARDVLACSLRPLGVRFAEPVPVGVRDVGVEIWSQPDAFSPWDPPTGDDDAVALAGRRLTQQEMWEAAVAGTLVSDGGRLLVTADPTSPPVLAVYTEPLAKGGSLVLATRAGQERLEAIAVAEHTTARFPA